MGVSFSLWVCQRILETISSRAAGISVARTLIDRQPPPDISQDFGHTEYVDNFVALSQQEAAAKQAAERVEAELQRVGLPTHPVESVFGKLRRQCRWSQYE